VEASSRPVEPSPGVAAADAHDIRAGVPRVPAPTAHQAMAELPNTSLGSGRLSPVNVRVHPAPSRAPAFASLPRAGDGPAPEAPHAPAHGAPHMDVSSQGAAPPSETSGARPRPSAPVPEGLVPDSTIHGSGAGLPSAGHGGLPPAGLQSAGPIPAELESIGRLRTEGQVLSGVPMQTGQRPPPFGNPMDGPGFPPQSWGFAGPPLASHGSINQGPYPYNAMPPAYSTGQGVPQFQQDLSGALPGLHQRSFGFSGGGPALSQGPIAPPVPPPAHGLGMAMPAVPSAAPPPAAPAQIPLSTHGSIGVHPPASFPPQAALGQIGTVPTNGTAASEPPMQAMLREGLQTVGRMPDEPDAPAGQGRPPRFENGVAPTAAAPGPAVAAPPPAAAAAPAPATHGIPPAEAAPMTEAPRTEAPRTEAPVPEQTHPVEPALAHVAHATPVSGTQCSSQTQGPLPHIPHEEQDQQSPDISQGQLLLDQGTGAEADVHHDDLGVADSPSGFQAESPLAPSGVPDLDSIEEASHQLETPPPSVQKMDQGQQTTPEKPRMPRRKRPQAEAIRLPKDPEFKLVQVDMDEVRSCNQAEGRPKRKQLRVLKGWKNERVVYERVPGSACPSICKVLVAQPLEKDQKAIPLELNLAEEAWQEVSPLKDKTSSPLPSNHSDYTYSLGQSEEEKISTFEEEPMEEQRQPQRSKRPRRNKSTSSRLHRVEMAAEVGSAAAAAAFEEVTPPRARPSHSANGFVCVPIAEGSTEACEIRVGLDNGNWMSCDINIPPRSFNTPEQLAENRALLIYVMRCQDGTFEANVDEDIVTLTTGSSMVIRPGQEYCLRNRSDQVIAELKMTLINSSRS